jgi:hypothetical protein
MGFYKPKKHFTLQSHLAYNSYNPKYNVDSVGGDGGRSVLEALQFKGQYVDTCMCLNSYTVRNLQNFHTQITQGVKGRGSSNTDTRLPQNPRRSIL